MKKIAIASHAATIDGVEYDGIGNALIEIMPDMGGDFTFIKHSMDGNATSRILDFQLNGQIKTKKMAVFTKPAPLRYISEIIATVILFSVFRKIDVFIGIDPLNALAGVLLKKLHRIDKVIFYTADYSKVRFTNKLLNSIYHWIDRFCVRHADAVWSVSSRIVEVRRDMGLAEEKNIFLPNVPPEKFDSFYQSNRNIHTLVTSGILDTQLDFINLFKAMVALRGDFPDIELKIFGNGPQQKKLEAYTADCGLGGCVMFMGKVPLRDMLPEVAKAGVGAALYTGEWGFNEYGDSTKCREYFNFGLPVLSTDTHATVDDIKEYEAGEIVALNAEAYEMALRKIFTDYAGYAERSKKLGDKYKGAHTRLLKDLLS